LLKKYFETEKKEFVVCYKDILIADGFDFNHTVSSSVSEGTYFFFLYNYVYSISVNQQHKIIKIYKK